MSVVELAYERFLNSETHFSNTVNVGVGVGRSYFSSCNQLPPPRNERGPGFQKSLNDHKYLRGRSHGSRFFMVGSKLSLYRQRGHADLRPVESMLRVVARLNCSRPWNGNTLLHDVVALVASAGCWSLQRLLQVRPLIKAIFASP